MADQNKQKEHTQEQVYRLCNIIKVNDTHYIKDVRLTLEKERQYLFTNNIQDAKRFSNQCHDYISKVVDETGGKCITLSTNE